MPALGGRRAALRALPKQLQQSCVPSFAATGVQLQPTRYPRRNSGLVALLSAPGASSPASPSLFDLHPVLCCSAPRALALVGSLQVSSNLLSPPEILSKVQNCLRLLGEGQYK